MSDEGNSRLTMASTEGNYATFIVIESAGDFSTSILENAVEGNLAQYNLNPPWIAFGEDVPPGKAIYEPTDFSLAVLATLRREGTSA